MGLISDLFSSNSYDASAAKAKEAAQKFAGKGYDAVSDIYKSGTAKATGALADPLEKINDIYEQEQLGRVAYMNALGLMGPENSEAARAMFQASPGYQYQLEQGSQNLLRNNALAGTTRSGGAMTDLNLFAQNAANQDWGNWLNRLQMFNPLQANAQNASLAEQLAGIYGNETAGLAGAAGKKFDTFGQSAADYQRALAANRAGAAGNAFDAIKFGVGTAAGLGGMAMGGGYFGGGGTPASGNPLGWQTNIFDPNNDWVEAV
jgi:hypothetical protein